MAVTWIKLSVDMMDNKKIKIIENMPNGDSMILIWIWLLSIAGETNDEGYIYLTEGVPYTAEMLASQFRKSVELTKQALEVFEQFSMIEYVDDCLRIKNWEKYQNIDGLDKVRDQNKERARNWRKRQKEKECNESSSECDHCKDDNSNVMHNADITQNNVTDNATNNAEVTQNNVTDNVTSNGEDIKNNVTHNANVTLHNVTRNVTHNAEITLRNALDIELDIDKDKLSKVNNNSDEKNEKIDLTASSLSYNDIIDQSDFDTEVKLSLKESWLPFKIYSLKSSSGIGLSNITLKECLDDLKNCSNGDKTVQLKIIKQAIKTNDYTFSPLIDNTSTTSDDVSNTKETHKEEQSFNEPTVASKNSNLTYRCYNNPDEFYAKVISPDISDEEWEEYYDKDPIEFLKAKQKCNVSNSKKKLLKSIKANWLSNNSVINVLIEFILESNNLILSKNYAESIAETWFNLGINDVKMARTAGLRLLTGYQFSSKKRVKYSVDDMNADESIDLVELGKKLFGDDYMEDNSSCYKMNDGSVEHTDIAQLKHESFGDSLPSEERSSDGSEDETLKNDKKMSLK